MNKVYILIALGVLVAGIIAAKTFSNKGSLDLQETTEITPTPAVSPTGTPSSNTSDWQLYSNKDLGIELKFPQDFKIEESGNYSVLASPEKNEDKVGMPRFFYLSVVSSDYSESDLEVIYNFNSPDFEKLDGMEVEEKLSLTDNQELKEWFTYERRGNVEVGGKTAKVFVNEKPWEFPPGTREIRYIVEQSEKKIIAGAYIDGPQTNGTFPQKYLEEIINTLVIK